jgi:phage gp37-like protein
MSLTALESEILARLRTQLGTDVHLLTSAALDDVSKGRALAPAVYVIYDGGSVDDPDGYQSQTLGQRWMVVATTRNAAPDSGQAARASAGVLADEVLAALSGWRPASAASPLLLSALPRPGYVAGFQTFPLEFSTSITRPLTAAP